MTQTIVLSGLPAHLAIDINALEKAQRFACRVAQGIWDLSSDQLLIAARRGYLQQCCLFSIVHGYSAFPNGLYDC